MKKLKPDAVTRFGIRQLVLLMRVPAWFAAEIYGLTTETVEAVTAGQTPRDDFDDGEIARLLRQESGDGSRTTYLFAMARHHEAVMRQLLREKALSTGSVPV